MTPYRRCQTDDAIELLRTTVLKNICILPSPAYAFCGIRVKFMRRCIDITATPPGIIPMRAS